MLTPEESLFSGMKAGPGGVAEIKPRLPGNLAISVHLRECLNLCQSI